MSITKADITTKITSILSPLANNQKVTAQDVNELKRVTDNLVDYVEGLGAATMQSGGVFVCDGSATPQNVAPLAEVDVAQFTDVQTGDNFGTEAGDSTLVIPVGGTYLIMFHINYQTTAKSGDVFKWRIVKNGVAVPGLCTRVPHERGGDSSYRAAATLMISCAAGDVLAIECEGFSLSTTRNFQMLHGSLTAWRRLNGV